MEKTRILTRLLCAVGLCTLISAVSALESSPILLSKTCLHVKSSTEITFILFTVPGFGGSQLDEKNGNYDYCNTGGNYKRVWYDLFLWRTRICSKDLQLRYDKSSNTYQNKTGIEVRVPGFGETKTVEYSAKFTVFSVKSYMNNLVQHFAKYEYERGISIRAAPYDWRLAADELDRTGYFKQVKGLIEEMRKANGQRVTIVAHSMGGLVSHYFLTGYSGIDQDWKKKHIKAWITLGTPWGGAVETIQTVLANERTASDWWKVLVPYGRTFESTAWLLPKPSLFGDKVLVETNSRKYTANDYEKLFDRINYEDGYAMFKGTQQIDSVTYPNVQTYCYYGKNLQTPERLTYKFGIINSLHKKIKGEEEDPIKNVKPKITHGDGDGTVNIDSLRVCNTEWSDRKGFESKEFDSADHKGILSDTAVLEDIAKIVGARCCGNIEQLEQLLEALN